MPSRYRKFGKTARGIRKLVEVRHMCTVHSDSKYVIASTTDVDPDVHPLAVEKAMDIVGDKEKPRSMRENARIWFASEYIEYICKRHKATNPKSSRWHRNKKPRELDDDIRLLEMAARVRQDAAEFAHIMLLKKKIGRKYRLLNFSVDRELSSAATQHVVLELLGHRKMAEIPFAEFQFGEEHPFQAIKEPLSIILSEGKL